jgi:hypothetical protein
LLIEAARDLSAEQVWNRPKQGFVLPFADWMRGPLAADVTRTLGDRDRLHALGLSPEAVRAVWTAFVGTRARCDVVASVGPCTRWRGGRRRTPWNPSRSSRTDDAEVVAT